MILLIIGFTIVALIDLPPLIKTKHSNEIIVFSCLFVFAFIISFLQVIGIIVASPAKALMYLLKDVLHIEYK